MQEDKTRLWVRMVCNAKEVRRVVDVVKVT
jgi:hypothetical protein